MKVLSVIRLPLAGGETELHEQNIGPMPCVSTQTNAESDEARIASNLGVVELHLYEQVGDTSGRVTIVEMAPEVAHALSEALKARAQEAGYEDPEEWAEIQRWRDDQEAGEKAAKAPLPSAPVGDDPWNRPAYVLGALRNRLDYHHKSLAGFVEWLFRHEPDRQWIKMAALSAGTWTQIQDMAQERIGVRWPAEPQT